MTTISCSSLKGFSALDSPYLLKGSLDNKWTTKCHSIGPPVFSFKCSHSLQCHHWGNEALHKCPFRSKGCLCNEGQGRSSRARDALCNCCPSGTEDPHLINTAFPSRVYENRFSKLDNPFNLHLSHIII